MARKQSMNPSRSSTHDDVQIEEVATCPTVQNRVQLRGEDTLGGQGVVFDIRSYLGQDEDRDIDRAAYEWYRPQISPSPLET